MGMAPTKLTTDGENNSIKYAASSMQGSAAEMEDAHTIILQLNGTSDSFFGVYDGHGGAEVALYCSRQFHIELRQHSNYSDNLLAAMKGACTRIDEKLKQSDDWRTKDYPPGIRKLIRHLGVAVCAVKWPWKTPYLGPLQVGSTACVTVVKDNQIIVGNIGDTRCVLSMRGQGQVGERKIIDLTIDHKPEDEEEEKRIVTAGGKVYKDELHNAVPADLGKHRIHGKLHISRAFGDFQFKQNKNLLDSQQMVTSSPHTYVVNKTDRIEFLLTASSGIWSCMTSKEAVESVLKSLQSGKSLRASCEALLDECMTLGSKENLTVILIQFKSDRQGVGQGTEDLADSEINKASDNEDTKHKKDETDEDEDEEKSVDDPGNGNTSQEPPPKTSTVASFGIQGKSNISDKGSKGCFDMKGLGFKGCFQGWLNHEKDGTAASGSHNRSDSPSPVKGPE